MTGLAPARAACRRFRMCLAGLFGVVSGRGQCCGGPLGGLEDDGAWCAAEPWRASRVGPDSGPEDVQEVGGACGVFEVELDDDVAVVVDRLADAIGRDSAMCPDLCGPVERRPPLVVVGDGMLDVQGRHPTIVGET